MFLSPLKADTTTGELTGNKIVDTITKVFLKKLHHRIVQKQFKISMIKKYLKKDIYLQKKDRKLLMI